MTPPAICLPLPPTSAARPAGLPAQPASQARLRVATEDDRSALLALHRCALLTLSQGHYTDAQVRSLLRHVPTLDPSLIAERTYFVAELEGQIVACGGWSDRAPGYLHAGEFDRTKAGDPCAPLIRAMYMRPSHARRGLGRQVLSAAQHAASLRCDRPLELDALLAGVPLYLSAGYEPIGESDWRLPDGERIAVVRMRQRRAPHRAGPRPG